MSSFVGCGDRSVRIQWVLDCKQISLFTGCKPRAAGLKYLSLTEPKAKRGPTFTNQCIYISHPPYYPTPRCIQVAITPCIVQIPTQAPKLKTKWKMKIETTGNRSRVSVPTLLLADRVTGCIRWRSMKTGDLTGYVSLPEQNICMTSITASVRLFLTP